MRDVTPTERRSDFGQGDPEPATMALRIIHDAKREAEKGQFEGLTAAEVCDVLGDELMGQSRKPVSPRTTRRWLDRWVEDGILTHGKPALLGKHRNVKTTRYTTPPLRVREEPEEVLRAMSVFEGDLSNVSSDPSESLKTRLTSDLDPEAVSLVNDAAVADELPAVEGASQGSLSHDCHGEAVSTDSECAVQSLTGDSPERLTNPHHTDTPSPGGLTVSQESQNVSQHPPGVVSPEDWDAAFGV